MAKLWTEKYRPKHWNEFIGNADTVAKVKAWAEKWAKGIVQKPILLYGPVGNGKTSLAYVCANEMNWELFEMNASDVRTKEAVQKLAGTAAKGASFFAKRRLILLDEVDGLQAQDRGGAEAIAKILEETKNPIILTANDIYANKKLAYIRDKCIMLEMKKVPATQIVKLLERICRAENLQYEPQALLQLAKKNAGDIRASVLDLQLLASKGRITLSDVESLAFREREENIFIVLAQLFRAKSFGHARLLRSKVDVDEDMLLAWIEENIPRHFDAEDTARAFDYLSKADVIEGRIIKRQCYGLKRYSLDLATACAVLARSKDYHGWVKYQFPHIVRELSASMERRKIKDSICKKIAKKIHKSAKSVANNEFPVFLYAFRSSEQAAKAIAEMFELDEAEIEFMQGPASAQKQQR